jgi:hypothetical protein
MRETNPLFKIGSGSFCGSELISIFGLCLSHKMGVWSLEMAD